MSRFENKWWRKFAEERSDLTEQEMQEVMENLWKDCMKPDVMLVDRQVHREAYSDCYPDYWPSYEKIREIEKSLAP